MPLGIDASLNYALGHPAHATESELATDSPYNIREVAGLPPTPIAVPGPGLARGRAGPGGGGVALLRAGRRDGRHTFTDTYDEFLEAKARVPGGRALLSDDAGPPGWPP